MMRPGRKIPQMGGIILLCVSLGWGIAQAGAVADGDTLFASLTAEGYAGLPVLQGGDTLMVQLEIPRAGPAFNAFDAYVRFDPAVLQFLPANSLRDQAGPLMLDACPQNFHLFSVSADSSLLEIHFSMLCAGVSVTGPGVAYQVRFRCRDVDADTHLDLLTEPGFPSRFFLDGLAVEPLTVTRLFVRVGAGASAVPAGGGSSLLIAPNPCNAGTVLAFDLARAASCGLDIFDLRGRHVRTLLRGLLDAGRHRVAWDGRDDAGAPVASGPYTGVLTTDGLRQTARVTVLK